MTVLQTSALSHGGPPPGSVPSRAGCPTHVIPAPGPAQVEAGGGEHMRGPHTRGKERAGHTAQKFGLDPAGLGSWDKGH